MFRETQTYRVQGVLLVGRAPGDEPTEPLTIDCEAVAASPADAAEDAAWIVASGRGYRAWRWQGPPTVTPLDEAPSDHGAG